ncbi:hypothetical protein [Paraflavitalea pollutisoli]|uniref:hypothetical protein n=1 Tax=Paraflavitalea pollutisoli TaxID=3034143 RepID=UPI0023EAA024|nr:hypothetical protein [Paraflavitalea sp. H1-2-19X]
MKATLILLSCLATGQLFGQQQTYDIVNYTPPANWKEEKGNTHIVYARVDGGSWAQIAIYQHTHSSGDIQADFEKEWKALVATPYNLAAPSEKAEPGTADGWAVMSGSGVWQREGSNVATILTTYSNSQVCISVLCHATAKPYLDDYKKFIAGLDLPGAVSGTPDGTVAAQVTAQGQQPAAAVSPQPMNTGYQFNETNFDDGWKAVVQPDWVDVTKGPIKVLLHYPKDGTVIAADPEPLINAAWNILVAPRYKDVQHYKTASVSSYHRPYLGMALATDQQSGQRVLVVLYRREHGWVEIIAPDVTAFAQEYGFDPMTIRWAKITEYMGGDVVDNREGKTIELEPEIFKQLDHMSSYNRFAVAANDLNNTGKWDANFASNTFYYNTYTGASAGMSTYSSSQWFEFGANHSYTWQLAAANSGMGTTKFAQAKGKGIFKSVNNWQLKFPDIGGNARLYDVYFVAIKNDRVLFMNDAEHPGSGVFTGFGKKK